MLVLMFPWISVKWEISLGVGVRFPKLATNLFIKVDSKPMVYLPWFQVRKTLVLDLEVYLKQRLFAWQYLRSFPHLRSKPKTRKSRERMLKVHSALRCPEYRTEAFFLKKASHWPPVLPVNTQNESPASCITLISTKDLHWRVVENVLLELGIVIVKFYTAFPRKSNTSATCINIVALWAAQ